METLTKTVEQMSEGFAQPDTQESFTEWAERSAAHSNKEQKEKQKSSGLRVIKLAGRPEEERQWIEQVGQKPADETKDSAKKPSESSAEKEAAGRTEERPDAKAGEKTDAKAGEKPASESTKAPVEPIAADLAERHWQGKLQGQEIESHIRQVSGRIGVVTDFLNSHPQRSQMEQGFKALFDGRPPAERDAFFRDLTVCLAELRNPTEVFRHITLEPNDRQALRQCKNAQELRTAIRTISQHYPASASQASPKPRAPKPPSEVGGRGSAPDDGTFGDGDFTSFSTKMDQRYARHAR